MHSAGLHLRAQCLVCFALVWLAPVAARAELVVFGIGNSLTNTFEPGRLTSLSSGPNGLDFSYHIRGNTSISEFISEPYNAAQDFITARGPYSQALPSTSNKLDALMLQPYYHQSIRDEVQAAVQMVQLMQTSPLNANARVLIYQTWPALPSESSYSDVWATTGLTLDSMFVPSQLGHELFMNEFRKSVPQAEAIPVGHVYAEIDRLAKQGEVPGISSVKDFYGDQVHPMNNGSYVAALTVNSVIFGTSPLGQPYPAPFLDPAFGTPLEPNALPVVQSAIYSTLHSSVPEPNSLSIVFVAWGLTAFRRRSRCRANLRPIAAA